MITKEKLLHNIKISVIIPVFNVEGYIDACISSLQAQTLRELEFIFVDDCGTDSSMLAVEEFADRDTRVRIIRNPKNLGAGPSRNRGIEFAKGEYLSFVDPDDRLAPDFYDLLYDKAVTKQTDIVKGMRVRERLHYAPIANLINSNSFFNLNSRIRIAQNHNIPLYCVFTFEHTSAIYRRNIFDDPFVRYGTSKNAEDTTFLLRAALSAPAIKIENRAIYYYRQRNASATAFYSKTRAFEELLSYIEKMDTLSDATHALLTDNNNAQIYLINMLSEYYSNACFSRIQDNWTEEDETRYIELLEDVFLRLDVMFSHYDLLNRCTELKVMREYKTWISSKNRMQGLIIFDRVQAWTDFLIQHPNADMHYVKGCSNAIANLFLEYALHRKTGSDTLSSETSILNENNKKDRPLRFVRRRLKQLTPSQETAVLRTLPGSFLFVLKKKLMALFIGFE